MKQVHVLESFEDIEKAFCQIREVNDKTPTVDDKAMIHIRGDSLSLVSEDFVLAEEMREKGAEFVSYCISRVVGGRFTTHRLKS